MSLYETLGVGRDADADAVKRAYRKKAQETHPDKGGDTATFQAVQRAYDVLGDDAKREEYDRTGREPNVRDERAEVMGELATMIMHFATKEDVDHVNIVEEMRKNTRDSIKQLKKQIPALEKTVAK